MIALLLAGALAGECLVDGTSHAPVAAASVPEQPVERPVGQPLEWREALAEADAHYARRGVGSGGPVASSGEIEAAIVAYRRALQACPGEMRAINGLLSALFFRGAFTGATRDAQRSVFAEAKKVGEEGIAHLERGLPSGRARLAALKNVDGAPALYFWAAVSWGQWALSSGRLAAVRQGAAARVRDLAQTAIDLDPEYDQGSAYLILGRLHDQTPRVLFLTFWISRAQALKNLRRAHAISPTNTVTLFFLADAILRHEPKNREEARRLLTECANAHPRPAHLVEDAHYSAKSKDRLASL